MLGGSGWGDKHMPANVNYVGHVYTRDHNAFNCSARAVLNVNRDSMASYGFSPPTRIFEAAGSAACLITDAWEGIEAFLTPDREVLVANDADDVVQHLLALDDQRAKQIGQAAMRRVLSEHTYQHRALQLQRLLEGAAVAA
jgi:spore maturation protein CgeB